MGLIKISESRKKQPGSEYSRAVFILQSNRNIKQYIPAAFLLSKSFEISKACLRLTE